MIKIKQNYKSSVRLDEKFSEKQFIDGLVLHGTALNAIEVLSREFSETSQRCFTLTGPYGSGKSTIALFMSLLLSHDANIRKLAHKKLESSNTDLTINSCFSLDNGWQVVKHVCGLEEPGHAIAQSISTGLTGKSVKIGLSDADYLGLIEKALNKKSTFDGVILLLDEMGKALDYQSRENKDLYFFQELADKVQKAQKPVMLVGFLHQSFSEYSRSMTAQVQREWAKVQGRYRDIGYSPSTDESLILIGETLSKDTATQRILSQQYKEITALVGSELAKRPEVVESLNNALPIEPVVSLLLGPISKRSFSQNERSLFGFLASSEKLSFNQFVIEHYSKLESEQSYPLYNCDLFWEYLNQNLDHVISSSRDSQAWLEAKDAVYRATLNGSELHESITKLIALVTLFGYQHQLFASREFVSRYFQQLGFSLSKIKASIKDLENWSVIIYRPNHAALTIFQGSDIDVNELVAEKIDQIKDGIDWTKNIDLTQHALASAHYHKTGTMRWVQARVISEKGAKEFLSQNQISSSSKPFLYFFIAADEAAQKALVTLPNASEKVVVGKNAKSIEILKTYALELSALKEILKQNKQIVHDRIAKTELNNRILTTERLIEQELERTFAAASWTFNSHIYSHQSLSSIASKLADDIYCKAPVVINELVNRTKPSGSANAAIKKLVLAMAEDFGSADLALPTDTFPAEKGLYYSCLKKFGLHQKVDSEYQFTSPNEPRLKALFETTHQELVANSNTVVWLSEIDEFWSKEPYGLSKGIRSIWLMAFVLVHLRDYAFYDKNEQTGEVIFITEPDDEFAQKLIQKPQNVAVQAIHVDQQKTAYLTNVAKVLDEVADNDQFYSNNVKPLTVAEGLVTFFSRLSNLTLVTRELLPKARKFIEITKRASDPHDYLFSALPKVLETPLDDITVDQVKDLLLGLRNHHVETLEKFEHSIREQLGKSLTLANCELVLSFSHDHKLKAFTQRLSEIETSGGNWVSNLISLLSSKSEKNWDDNAIKKAEAELPEFVEKFKLAVHRAKFKDTSLLSAVKKQYQFEFNGIKAKLEDRTLDEQRSILVALLEELEIKEGVDEV